MGILAILVILIVGVTSTKSNASTMICPTLSACYG